MPRQMIFLATINSITDTRKNTQEEKPLVVVYSLYASKLMKKEEAKIRAKFVEIKQNQIIHTVGLQETEHYRNEDGSAICKSKTKKRISEYQDFEDFVNCWDCLRRLKKDKEAEEKRIESDLH